jgi:hypothetical protein
MARLDDTCSAAQLTHADGVGHISMITNGPGYLDWKLLLESCSLRHMKVAWGWAVEISIVVDDVTEREEDALRRSSH